MNKQEFSQFSQTLNKVVNSMNYHIDYLNKDKGFKRDRIYFESYEQAQNWARKNFDNFHPDMIKCTL